MIFTQKIQKNTIYPVDRMILLSYNLEVFYYKPNCNMPCYTCTYGEDKGVDYNNQAIRRQFYATEKELQRMTFQPGMYMDIEIVALFTAVCG